MGLLDRMLTANGDASAPYAKRGRHLVRLQRAYLRDPSEDQNATKAGGGFDGIIVSSTRSESDPTHAKGNLIRVNDGFKFPDTALARMRRGIAACATSKTSKVVDESTFDQVKSTVESDKEFGARVATELKRLFGPTQPCRGALVVFECTERDGQQKNPDGTPKTYTLFEVKVPTEDDLKSAGLI